MKYITKEEVLKRKGYYPDICALVDIGIPLGSFVILNRDASRLRGLFELLADRCYDVANKNSVSDEYKKRLRGNGAS